MNNRGWPVSGGWGQPCAWCDKPATHTRSAGTDVYPYSLHECDDHVPQPAGQGVLL